MRGRKPKPTALRVIDGTAARHTREPRPVPKIPTCPAHLSPTAKAEWKRLAQHLFALGVVTELDRAALASYCQAYAHWVEAEKKLRETPTLIKLPSGYIQQSPWLAIANKQLELMHRYMTELGLSPVSRSRVDARPPAHRSKFAGLLGGQPERPADRYLYGPKPWE
jgi:P27 family predicted phage terminase small subunit